MTGVVGNASRSPRYFDVRRREYVTSPSELLARSTIGLASLRAHELNSAHPVDRPDTYHPVLPGIVPIPPRSRWYFDDGGFSLIPRQPRLRKASFETLRQDVKRLLAPLASRTVAVESSGGLDCSIIIGMLRDSGIDPWLVSAEFPRYEFRTENCIQRIVASRDPARWLKITPQESLPFSGLSRMPLHLLPSPQSVFYAFAAATARVCSSRGIKLVISGDGFDALLVDSLAGCADVVPLQFYPWMHVSSWFNEYVFRPSGIVAVPGAALWRLVEWVVRMRSGQETDDAKIWARNFFAPLLPRQLVEYNYKASGQGIWTEGVRNAEVEILRVCDIAFSAFPEPKISPAAIKPILSGSASGNLDQMRDLITRVSFAVWVSTLVSHNYFG